MSSPAGHDAAALLREWWDGVAVCRTDDPEEAGERHAITAPFGSTWPGPAPSPDLVADPDEHARALATRLLQGRPALRIGLIPAGSGADALSACGWSGPVNHENDTGKIAAVLRSWEERFGARVVGAGFNTLHLSIAAPPASMSQARVVAAEHLALCPDNILQGTGTLTAYAQCLVSADSWMLWWD
ncbi:DUF4253 domain-containing protein [Streptomyces kaniharaensis]|uniref:DUF4253 domain-containing protein n=1 Tax=Streptomyces kaniharaensis TaxID=212423 RepID=UPI001E297856|nr:DUF4253 domain-containing protein [Streptomyces kaniharaensis]